MGKEGGMSSGGKVEQVTPRYRPAFYALNGTGWRDYFTLLHPPYTAWHLSYVVLGVALAPTVHLDRLVATLIAFFLAMGVASHALDELSGRPLNTRIPDTMLWILAIDGLGMAVAMGLAGSILVTPWLLAFIAFGLFIAPAYNLEWLRGFFHNDFWFAFAWGSFPFLTAYWTSGEHLQTAAIFGATGAFALSLAQRNLSSRVREIRRRVRSIEGKAVYLSGEEREIDRLWAIRPLEQALMMMAVSIVAISVGALLVRL
jgi:hypothetical protein